MTFPSATFRLQLRDGCDFAAAEAFLPHLETLRISHLYLSPIFTARRGSTHGYDVTRPDQIDPVLGGETGFVRLAQAAAERGIGIVLDIVPNHTAFDVENTWLRDVLRHGTESRYAGHFDIDWSQRLILPFLPDPFAAMLEAGAVAVEEEAGGPALRVGDIVVPLAPASVPSGRPVQPDALRALHDAQIWRLTHWERERDSVTHRRFFNVTGLIGMRVEDGQVFEDMHRAVFDLVDQGLVQGLRVDHIDGLADPDAYLARLARRLGPVPIWVEKILTGDEALPQHWPVAGTTGYEAARQICRLLTDPAGYARLTRDWRAATDAADLDFHAAVQRAKAEVIRQDLAAELHQLIALGREATVEMRREQGDEALREATIGLLLAFPRYRTFLTPETTRPEDIALMQQAATEAAASLRSPATVDLLVEAIVHPASAAARRLQTRYQQVTGALLAKSHEDTAAFRWSACLAANEVGADPDAATTTPEAFAAWLQTRPAAGLTLTSSHDTKRSEDSRMRIAAITHLPGEFHALLAHLLALPGAGDVDVGTRWYLAQSVLGIWDLDDPDLADRLCDHMTKALREAKEATNWSHPDASAEAPVLALARAVVAAWRANPPASLTPLIRRGRELSLQQLALKMVLPGVPDIYQSALGEHLALTDPDNRRPVDAAGLARGAEGSGFSAVKAGLTRALLALRADAPQFFESASSTVTNATDGAVTIHRSDGREIVTLTLGRPAAAPGGDTLWDGAGTGYEDILTVERHR